MELMNTKERNLEQFEEGEKIWAKTEALYQTKEQVEKMREDWRSILPKIQEDSQIPTCATCKHWQRDPDNYETRFAYDPVTGSDLTPEEEIERFGYEVRDCKCPRLGLYERPGSDSASVSDGSTYMAVLTTGPDFSCIMHERA